MAVWWNTIPVLQRQVAEERLADRPAVVADGQRERA